MKTKAFDCVAMKHAAAEKIYEQTRGMNREEELAFWKQGEEEIKRLCRQDQPQRGFLKFA